LSGLFWLLFVTTKSDREEKAETDTERPFKEQIKNTQPPMINYQDNIDRQFEFNQGSYLSR
jgi:hypothetical protein